MSTPKLTFIKGIPKPVRKPAKKVQGKPKVKVNVVRVLQPGGLQKTAVRVGGFEEE